MSTERLDGRNSRYELIEINRCIHVIEMENMVYDIWYMV